MANTILTSTVLAKESMMQLENYIVFPALVYKGYEKEWTQSEYKKGDTIPIKKPNILQSGDGEDVTEDIQNLYEQSVNLVLDQWKHIAVEVTAKEMTLKLSDFSEQIIVPAMIEMADTVDTYIAGLYKQFHLNSGTPGTTLTAFSELGTAQAILDRQGVPYPRHCVLDPTNYWSYANAFKDMQVQEISKSALKEGKLPNIARATYYESQNIKTHTKPSAAQATVTVTSTLTKNSTLNQIAMTGLDADVRIGDIFTIADVYGVNPQNKSTLSTLQPFVATANVSYTGTGDTVTFSPTIVMSDDLNNSNRQNVSAYPVAAGAITFKHTTLNSVENLLFHKNAIAFAAPPIAPLIASADNGRDTKNGVSVSVTKWADAATMKNYIRFDILFGAKVIYPELGLRLLA